MKCLYCDKTINKYSLISTIEKDCLCVDCRKGIRMKRRISYYGDLEVMTIYEYESLFKSVLLQYKECYDEALKDVFLYCLEDYLKFRYRGYHIVYVPSSKHKKEERGFEHLRLIFERLKFKEVKGLVMKTELIQEGKNTEERLKMKSNYSYEGDYHEKILIVDDVVTTGSSLLGVYSALRPYSREIKAFVLARV